MLTGAHLKFDDKYSDTEHTEYSKLLTQLVSKDPAIKAAALTKFKAKPLAEQKKIGEYRKDLQAAVEQNAKLDARGKELEARDREIEAEEAVNAAQMEHVVQLAKEIQALDNRLVELGQERKEIIAEHGTQMANNLPQFQNGKTTANGNSVHSKAAPTKTNNTTDKKKKPSCVIL